MRYLVPAICLLVGLALVWSAEGQAPRPNQVEPIMQAKLRHSQKLLESIALGDLEKVAKESQALSLLAAEANWSVLQTPKYLRYSSDFRHAADAITDAARDRNLDGAALGYVQLTMSCVQCHKHVRDVRDAN